MAGTSSSYQDEGATIAEINVTPLVDVVLVLLVVLMVTAPMIAAQGILVDSPKAASGAQVQSTLTLSITDVGVLVVSTDKSEYRFEPADRQKAQPIIEKFHAEFPEAKAIVAGDRKTPHGDVVEVIDMVKTSGIEKFAIRTKMKSTEDGDSD